MEIDKKIFYNGNRLLSHDCRLHYVIGNRGCGKTYWFKKWCIKDFIKTGKQFVYLRRYSSELDEGKKERWADDIKHEFPDHEITIKGMTIFCDKKPCGFFMTLSKALTMKSVPFPQVDKIIYDEFITSDKRRYYLKDEVREFLDLLSTLMRLKSGMRIFLLSNAISVSNPYFAFYKINKLNKEFTKVNKLTIIEYIDNPEYKKVLKNSEFGELVKGTSYAKYAIENEFLLDDGDTFIGKKTKKAYLDFNFLYKGNYYGVWVDYSVGKYFISYSHDKNYNTYVLTLEDHKPNTMVIKGRSQILKRFVENYRMGNVWYENVNIKNISYEMIRLFLI